jgi:hypothetical protein
MAIGVCSLSGQGLPEHPDTVEISGLTGVNAETVNLVSGEGIIIYVIGLSG